MAETIVFNGVTYRRYPEAARQSDRDYYRAGAADIMAGAPRTLHRAVYEYYHGPIPEGYHVHHKDGDLNNNSPENLEIIEAGEHSTLHHLGRKVTNFRPNPEGLRKAAEWHRSPEGHRWHTRNSYQWLRICPMCDAVFTTTNKEAGGKSTDKKGKKSCCRSHSQLYNTAVRAGRIQPISNWDTYLLGRINGRT